MYFKYPSTNPCQVSSVRKASQWNTRGYSFNPRFNFFVEFILLCPMYASIASCRNKTKTSMSLISVWYFGMGVIDGIFSWYFKWCRKICDISRKIVGVKSYILIRRSMWHWDNLKCFFSLGHILFINNYLLFLMHILNHLFKVSSSIGYILTSICYLRFSTISLFLLNPAKSRQNIQQNKISKKCESNPQPYALYSWPQSVYWTAWHLFNCTRSLLLVWLLH